MAQPLPEGLVAQALIRQDQISWRPVVGRMLRQQRVPRRWARGGRQARGDGFGGQRRVGRSGGRVRHQGLWRREPQGVERRRPSSHCSCSSNSNRASLALLRTLLPRRPRGREQKNRHGQNSATGKIFRITIHKSVSGLAATPRFCLLWQGGFHNAPQSLNSQWRTGCIPPGPTLRRVLRNIFGIHAKHSCTCHLT